MDGAGRFDGAVSGSLMKYSIVAYKGGESEGHAPGGVREVWGSQFPLNVEVDISDEKLLAKLRAMGCFNIREVGDAKEPSVAPVAVAVGPTAPLKMSEEPTPVDQPAESMVQKVLRGRKAKAKE